MIEEKDKKRIEEMPEYEAYFFIDAVGAFTWRMRHDAGHGRIEMTPELKAEIERLLESQQYCAQQLSKFGVDPESVKDRENGSYWKWYSHWDNWKKAMSDEEWYAFDKRMSAGEDISQYLPKQKWNEIPA